MTKKIKKHRYKHFEGVPGIEVRVKSAQQLFDARDPAPFRERDLDDDFVEYVMSSAREFPIATDLKIIIYVVENEQADYSKEIIVEAIRGYLSYQIDLQEGELSTFLKRAQYFLLIGILMLIMCLGVAQMITVSNSPSLLGILRDGIVIFGWVSIWKPIELILFDWYPLYEKLRFYRKVLNTQIDIHFGVNGK